MPPVTIRLNRYIAQTGLCSRRQADEYIQAGKVRINGEVVTQLGTQIDPTTKPVIKVAGKILGEQPSKFTYLMLNKPTGFVVTKEDEHAQHTVMELLPKSLHYLKPVGRLDKNSQGLLLFSNDGDFIQRVTHPSFEHTKEYCVTVREKLTEFDLKQLAQGVRLEEGDTGQNEVRLLNEHVAMIVLHQGWKRQIRRMFRTLDKHVIKLERLRIGKLTLGQLPLGKWAVIPKPKL